MCSLSLKPGSNCFTYPPPPTRSTRLAPEQVIEVLSIEPRSDLLAEELKRRYQLWDNNIIDSTKMSTIEPISSMTSQLAKTKTTQQEDLYFVL